jgi:hypothetical protein
MQLIGNLVASTIYEAVLQVPLILIAKRSAKIFLRSYEVSCEAAQSASEKTVDLVVAPEDYIYGAVIVLVGNSASQTVFL